MPLLPPVIPNPEDLFFRFLSLSDADVIAGAGPYDITISGQPVAVLGPDCPSFTKATAAIFSLVVWVWTHLRVKVLPIT